jgi:hypothetical protein
METITNTILGGIGLTLLLILLVYFILIMIFRWIEKVEDKKDNNSL